MTSNIFTYTPPFGTKPEIGNSQPLRADFTPNDALNYSTVSKTVTINVYKVTRLPNGMIDNLTLYPNPATEGFSIEGFEGSATVSLLDYSGRLIFSRQVIAGEIIPMNSIVEGLYFVRIVTSVGEIQKKLTKKR